MCCFGVAGLCGSICKEKYIKSEFRDVEVLKKAMLYDQGKTVADKKVKQPPRVQRASNGRFVKQKGGKVQKLIERAQTAKGANKRDAQADAVAAMLMGE